MQVSCKTKPKELIHSTAIEVGVVYLHSRNESHQIRGGWYLGNFEVTYIAQEQQQQ